MKHCFLHIGVAVLALSVPSPSPAQQATCKLQSCGLAGRASGGGRALAAARRAFAKADLIRVSATQPKVCIPGPSPMVSADFL
jgi:hypothetical protein